MRLDPYEADILCMFLNEHRKEFVKCCQGFDDYDDKEAEEMLEGIREKLICEMFRDTPKRA
jgi:hypothetical protein